ncbi:MAG: esterase/lipase family protein, partial [Microcoleaceae cyanobacterium]
MDINGPGQTVLLIHGIFDTHDIFLQMSQYLINLGWDVHSFNLSPNTGGIGLDKLAEQVGDYVNKKFLPDQLFNIVG